MKIINYTSLLLAKLKIPCRSFSLFFTQFAFLGLLFIAPATSLSGSDDPSDTNTVVFNNLSDSYEEQGYENKSIGSNNEWQNLFQTQIQTQTNQQVISILQEIFPQEEFSDIDIADLKNFSENLKNKLKSYISKTYITLDNYIQVEQSLELAKKQYQLLATEYKQNQARFLQQKKQIEELETKNSDLADRLVAQVHKLINEPESKQSENLQEILEGQVGMLNNKVKNLKKALSSSEKMKEEALARLNSHVQLQHQKETLEKKQKELSWEITQLKYALSDVNSKNKQLTNKIALLEEQAESYQEIFSANNQGDSQDNWNIASNRTPVIQRRKTNIFDPSSLDELGNTNVMPLEKDYDLIQYTPTVLRAPSTDSLDEVIHYNNLKRERSDNQYILASAAWGKMRAGKFVTDQELVTTLANLAMKKKDEAEQKKELNRLLNLYKSVFKEAFSQYAYDQGQDKGNEEQDKFKDLAKEHQFRFLMITPLGLYLESQPWLDKENQDRIMNQIRQAACQKGFEEAFRQGYNAAWNVESGLLFNDQLNEKVFISIQEEIVNNVQKKMQEIQKNEKQLKKQEGKNKLEWELQKNTKELNSQHKKQIRKLTDELQKNKTLITQQSIEKETLKLKVRALEEKNTVLVDKNEQSIIAKKDITIHQQEKVIQNMNAAVQEKDAIISKLKEEYQQHLFKKKEAEERLKNQSNPSVSAAPSGAKPKQPNIQYYHVTVFMEYAADAPEYPTSVEIGWLPGSTKLEQVLTLMHDQYRPKQIVQLHITHQIQDQEVYIVGENQIMERVTATIGELIEVIEPSILHKKQPINLQVTQHPVELSTDDLVQAALHTTHADEKDTNLPKNTYYQFFLLLIWGFGIGAFGIQIIDLLLPTFTRYVTSWFSKNRRASKLSA
ncbi:MAG: hypothetical protein AAF770_00020 [Bacteroidota bacterium]